MKEVYAWGTLILALIFVTIGRPEVQVSQASEQLVEKELELRT